ncbi:hypothetical protein HW555_005013 [Spodoptera exigua]|uniref:DRBM domain-containing protein n=1 Tax=Spodoptera exigua TaxID=7107 RepID=A0A835GKV2_SPOEX|nr:hypothetical protein HW555_005013 [Spodoptera exigua]
MMDAKSFLYSWCAKKGITPVYDIRATGPKHRQRFLCEVRVGTITYVGAGNSTTKKDAQMNASKDFVSYLIRSGEVDAEEIPEETRAAVKIEDDNKAGGSSNDQQQPQQPKPVFQVCIQSYYG